MILVFDITDRESISHVQTWYDLVIKNVGPTVPMIIVGNKCDLEENRKITPAMGE